ncbi:putative phage abortive infection protein [Prolixibacter bellariivorans]|nr:putative phage abortive infection protein [Prolixibacter bellariivorans]
MNSKKGIWLFTGITLIVISLIFFLLPYLVTQESWFWSFGQETGVIGDTIGGIVGPAIAFFGVILTFLAFYIQYKANQVQVNALAEQKKEAKVQRDQILLQQFESNFFELLKLHRENVSELSYRNSQGRNVIIKIINEFFEIMQIIIDSNIIKENRLDQQDLANISYTILFFGTDESVDDVLENRLFEKYSKMYDSIITEINRLRTKPNPYNQGKYYYNGHQSRLGHYFRHMIRIVLYVHNNKFLTEEQKYEYIRILRSQLSNHEQILLFFNSISDLGLNWELADGTKEEDKLITKYKMIKNIPLGSIYGYRPRRYYPSLELEHDFEIGL